VKLLSELFGEEVATAAAGASTPPKAGMRKIQEPNQKAQEEANQTLELAAASPKRPRLKFCIEVEEELSLDMINDNGEESASGILESRERLLRVSKGSLKLSLPDSGVPQVRSIPLQLLFQRQR
jgi:hypothetical protein